MQSNINSVHLNMHIDAASTWALLFGSFAMQLNTGSMDGGLDSLTSNARRAKRKAFAFLCESLIGKWHF